MKKILILILVLCSCTQAPQKAPEPSEPQPMPTQEQESPSFSWANPDWDQMLLKAIGESELMTARPKDLNEFGVMKDPKVFWGKILVTMSYWESKWKPDAKYQESFRDRSGKRIWSRGLFQLSLESGLGYKCPFRNQEDLHDPERNIKCAVLILERWVTRDNRIAGKESGSWRGGARYWAVLRGSREYTKNSLKAIKEANNAD